MATIKDVARLAGVGLGTASRVVSGKGSVAPATAKRVQRAIKQLNFRPSHAARSLLSGSTQMIGVYIPILKGTFYTPILQTIDAELRAGGRHMVVAFGHGSTDERRQAIEGVRFLINRDCDGLIVMSNALLEKDIVAFGREQPNIVVLNSIFPRLREQCFSADHVQGGVVAAKALLQHHHRRLAVIAGPASSPDNVARLKGFMDELRRHRIDPQTVRTIDSDFSPEGGWVSAKALLASKHRFTALFCANDEMAVGVLSYFQQAGLCRTPRGLGTGIRRRAERRVFGPQAHIGPYPAARGDDQWPQLPAQPLLRLAPAGRRGNSRSTWSGVRPWRCRLRPTRLPRAERSSPPPETTQRAQDGSRREWEPFHS